MSDQRWIWLIAGPNGAGKTTRAREFLAGHGEIVNADEIARQMSPDAPEETVGAAGRAAIERRQQLFKAGRSFSIETTLSGRTLVRFARTAGQEGWKVGLLYIGLRSAEQAIERVEQRVASGGHHIPPPEVRRRYKRSLANISSFVAITDHAVFVDNSLRGNPKRLLEIVGGRITFRATRLPAWLTDSLPQAHIRKSVRRS